MANNRMWLKHKPTGKTVLLAKYYPTGGWFAFYEGADLQRHLAELFRDSTEWYENPHGPCDGKIPLAGQGMWGDPAAWTLEFDVEEDG